MATRSAWIGSGVRRWRRAVVEVRRCDGLSQQPGCARLLDLNTLRIHYQRSTPTSRPGACTCGTPAHIVPRASPASRSAWDNPVRFASMPGYQALSPNEVVFDLPVLSPRTTPRALGRRVHRARHARQPNGGSGNKGRLDEQHRVDYRQRHGGQWRRRNLAGAGRHRCSTAPRSAPGLDHRCTRLLARRRLLQWPKASAGGAFSSTTWRAARSSPRSTRR